MEGNPNERSSSKISRRAFLGGAVAIGALAALGSKVRVEKEPIDHTQDHDLDLFNKAYDLPPEYKKNITDWMHDDLFKDPRVITQLNDFIDSIEKGKEPVYQGSVRFTRNDSLPQIFKEGNDEFRFSINTNFKFTDGVSNGEKLNEGEVVIDCGVSMNGSDSEELGSYRDHGVIIGRSGGIFGMSFIYNVHTGLMRKFPSEGFAEGLSRIFTP
ncbi:MAG: hypothetical protein JWN49_144 [Parcubacteria group bacterium]|nr:hypothetical protein [Parcubacteria group bacterium]